MRKFALALAAAVAFAAPALAADYKAGDLTVQQPWTRPAMAGMNGVGFMVIANAGAKPVKLLSAQSPVAGKVEMHSSSMTNGVMSMRRQDEGVTIPAKGQQAFAPGGYHFMLLGLKQPLTLGQKVPVTLLFDNGLRANIEMTVQSAATSAPMGSAAEHQHH
ncbi:copper chaperone PCu(A)C [Caulobacter sp.]|uniref:copper chaperone PCu(A)C n=1 Tax=Caulobacter sp. TaxID=78 RepID=UPI003BAB45AF